MAVFKAYDIRGVYGEELDENLFEKIGKSLKVLGDIRRVVIGCDMRNSSEPLKKALIKGINSIGTSVIDLGLASTPMLYQATHDFDVDLGIVITASHNSKEFNGMKLCRKNAVPIAMGTGIELIEECVRSEKFDLSDEIGGVEVVSDYSERYVSKLKSYFDSKRDIKVVLDCGNGMGGFLDNRILAGGCDLAMLYCELDGSFPNHEANPIKEETLNDLKKKVLDGSADIGFSFDGDADRIGVIDEKGNFVSADIVMAFLTDYLISNHPDKKVFSYDLRSSRVVCDIIEKNGCVGHETRVGHSYIKDEMRSNGSFFSGELSGHFYFWFDSDLVYDSAVRTGVELVNALSRIDKPLSEILEKYRVYVHSPEINFKVSDKEEKICEIREHFSDAKITELDGVTIKYSNWWCNVRASNTENVLRLNLEADDKKIYDEKLEEVKSILT